MEDLKRGENAVPVRIAAVQTVSGPVVSGNLEQVDPLIRAAATQGARLVVLPEYFGILGNRDTDKIQAAERPGAGPIQEYLATTARALGVWLVGGSVPLATATDDRVYNACLVFGPDGVLAARYDKIHLFGLDLGSERFSESRTIRPGHRVVTVDTPFARIGLSICYDLRFPELYRAMGDVDLILVPSAFTATTGQAHWEPLLRARAIENQAYVLAAAQGGRHPNGRTTHGHSMIIDPWGRVLAVREAGPGVVSAEFDSTELARVRRSLPALEHRTLVRVT
ncbi:MAG: carbon-nitrogen hydrolase family protein [Betaproteobacteria bacterium]|nr:carbon-nitrogen hydrolase family protein [Betaproteobacteria bacterium]